MTTTQRETVEVKFGDHTAIVKSYASAKEHNAIQATYFKGMKAEVVDDKPKLTEFDPTVQYQVKVEMVRQMVTSLDGSGDNIVDRCEELPVEDFDDLTSQIDAIIAKKKK